MQYNSKLLYILPFDLLTWSVRHRRQPAGDFRYLVSDVIARDPSSPVGPKKGYRFWAKQAASTRKKRREVNMRRIQELAFQPTSLPVELLIFTIPRKILLRLMITHLLENKPLPEWCFESVISVLWHS